MARDAGRKGEPPPERRDEEEPDEAVDRSEEEREAEGGMRASEPGHVSTDRVLDLVAEARDLEGHDVPGSEARERLSADAGPDEDIRPPTMDDAHLDAARRAAKRAARPTGTAE